MGRKAKVKIRPRFYMILLAIVMIIGVLVVVILSGGRDGELEMSAMRLNYKASTILIRDEISVPTERYDKILFDIAEGARVQDGDQIAQIFKWGYQEEMMRSLLTVQQQILEHQLTLVEDVVNPELESITLRINQKQLQIRSAASGQSDLDMLVLEQELKALIKERMDLLRDLQADETLNDLYAQEEQQIQTLSKWKRDILNQAGDGLVSFYFDGYEQALNVEKLHMINADLISNVLKGSGAVNATDVTSGSLLYRLVDSSHFYLAFLTESNSPFRLVEGEDYTVIFSGYTNHPYSGKALAPVVSEKNVVNMIEFTGQDMSGLLGVRVIEAAIMKDVNGLEIPLESIIMKDGLPGILRVIGDETQWVQVEILAADEEAAIIQAYAPEDTLVSGLRYRRQ